jgi:3-methyladenine DNA glycosylase AlkD
VLELALRLLQKPDFTYRFLAYEFVSYHQAARKSLGPAEVLQLGKGLDSWYAVDTFAPYISGPAWREGQLPDSLIHEWAASPDRWWRRAALVSTVALNNRARGGRGDATRTLVVCRLLVEDRDDMVVKAMSWALRELVKHDPEAVTAFLAENEDTLAARVRREVGNKLTTGLKNPRKRS